MSQPVPDYSSSGASSCHKEQNVVFFLPPNVQLLDLAGPAQVFDAAIQLGARYTLTFCSHRSMQTSSQGLVLAQLAPLPSVTADDLVIVPGVNPDMLSLVDELLDAEVRDWLRSVQAAGAPIASVCSGAFLLGEAGLLDGRHCTTHWSVVTDLQKRNPRAQVLDAVLFVHDCGITTSAGAASGIDMTLSLLERQQGPIFTAQVARYLVLYMRRNGSHAQSSVYLDYRTHLHTSVHLAQDYLIDHMTEDISLKKLAEVAQAANFSNTLPPSIEPGLETTTFWEPEACTFPNGTHVCVVEVDKETGQAEITRYIAVDDCGRQLNPLLVEGQVHGGIAQGIGQAMVEEVIYGEDGQLLTATLMDYAMPIAPELPSFETDSTVTLTPVNPLGVKGVGEAGTIGSTPAVANAVADALGVAHVDMPFTSEKLWNIIHLI